MKFIVVLLLFLFLTKANCECSVHYEMICDQISDLKNYAHKKPTSLIIGNHNKNPSEILKNGAFQDYKDLEELTIIGTVNQLEVEAFKELSKLVVLKLYKNSISTLTDFTFVVLPHLTKLNLQNNNIRYINTTGPFIYTNLKTVDLSYNKLRYLTWQAFAAPGLERLLITNNEVTEIGKADVFSKDLLLLNLDHNKLYNVPTESFSYLQKLQELILSNNHISTLWAKEKLSLTSLQKLDLSHNQIVLIDQDFFSQLPNLRHLYLNHNNIKQLPNKISNMKLYTLHLHSNRLENLDKVVNTPLQYLQELTFSNNPMPCNCVDNLYLYMALYKINTTDCEETFLNNATYPTCIGIESTWSEGKCIFIEPIDDYMYDIFDKNKNNC